MDSRDEIKNRVREAADIVQVIGECVELKKTGARFTGLCPFHAEKTPSFSVNPQGGFFHCFGCGESGDVFSFMMKYHHLTFPDALKDLARRYHIDLPERKLTDQDRARMRERENLYQVNREAAAIFQSYLRDADGADAARKYLRERGVPREVMEKYGLGYAPAPETLGWKFVTTRLQAKQLSITAIEQAGLAVKKDNGGYYDRFRDRVLFPIYDMSGREVAFGGRILGEGKPKYMNSPESMIFNKSRLLFGLYQHRDTIRQSRRAIVVEGNFDLLLLAVHGIDNVVAPLGTALTRSHIKSLRGYCDEVVLFFDGDSAGLKAARRSIPFFLAEQVEGKVALLPDGHDPDSLVRERGARGILELIDSAKPLPEFVFEALVREFGLSLSGKNRIMKELAQLVSEASDPGQRELMAAHFSEKLGVSPARFKSTVPQAVRALPTRSPKQASSLAGLPKKQRQLVDFLVLYPEYLAELLEAGLEEIVSESAVSEIISSLQKLAVDGVVLPEKLFSELSGEEDRQYIADLFMRGAMEGDGHETQGRSLCDELLVWLEIVRGQRESENLQEQINPNEEKSDSIRFIAHHIEQGQTLYSLSKQYHVSLDRLMEFNPSVKDGLSIGEVLKIPVVIDRNNVEEVLETAELHVDSLSERKPVRFVEHIVKPGETLFALSQKYAVSIDDIIEFNPYCKEKLSLGVLLKIPVFDESNLPLKEEFAQEKPEPPVLMCLDEFAVLGHMKTIEDAAGQIAGFGVKLWPVIQDLGQLNTLYKDRWQTFMANAGTLQFFANNDAFTLEWISKRLGVTSLIVGNKNEVGDREQTDTGKLGRSWSVQSRELMTLEEIGRFFGRDDPLARQLVMIAGYDPMILQRIKYDSHEMFAGLFDDA